MKKVLVGAAVAALPVAFINQVALSDSESSPVYSPTASIRSIEGPEPIVHGDDPEVRRAQSLQDLSERRAERERFYAFVAYVEEIERQEQARQAEQARQERARQEQARQAEQARQQAPTPSAPSQGSSVWDRLAQCESNGNWHINTGNGYSGGLQFHPNTWRQAGGQRYAPEAHMATREQQIAVAESWLARTSWSQWPACSAKLGLR